MVVSATSSTNSSSSLDVAGIVSQLMDVEKRPLTKLENKITASNVKITALGQFQSKLSAFGAALTALQNPTNFSARSVSSSVPTVASASADASLPVGRYQLTVNHTAEVVQTNITGFTSSTQAIAGSAYAFTIGSTTYTPGNSVTTPTALRDWINAEPGLKAKVEATLLQADSGTWVLSLRGLQSGATNALTTRLSGVEITAYQQAQDAEFVINGVTFTRPSNTVTDALSGLTLNLVAASATPTVLQVSTDSSQVRPKLEALVTAYNELQTYYKSQTQSSADAASRGVLNSDFALSSVMRELTNGLTTPITGPAGSALSGQSDLSLLGLEIKDDGSLAINETSFSASTGLQALLATGIRIGYDSAADVTHRDLSNRISAMVTSGGSLAARIDNEKTTQADLDKRRLVLQDKLVSVQARYTAQYAALDALLFTLNNTSTALKSALDSLTNSQKNN